MRSAGVNREGARAPKNVDAMCHEFQVFRPEAVANSTKVIPFKTLGRFTDEVMMGELLFAFSYKTSVAVAGFPKPEGTTIRAAGIGSFPETFFGGTGIYSLWHRVHSLMSMRAEGLTSRPPNYTVEAF